VTRAAFYARTSTADQDTANQVLALRDFCRRRDWPVDLEYVDDGISGATTSRPALDLLLTDARRGRFDVLVVWRLDRLGRWLRHLVTLLDELHGLGVAFVSVNDGIDLSTPAGQLMAHIIAAFAQYERTMIKDRVRLGLDRARRQGVRLGRPPYPARKKLDDVAHLSATQAAKQLHVSRASIFKWRKEKR
jgi:DNA invertase Pin-like site-specific DNA recombinase